MSKWDEIKNKVEENDNILTLSMIELRDALGKDKLGVHVRAAISNKLAGMGLGHIPIDLPGSQDELVRLYKRGTPLGELIEIVLAPGETNDRKLKEIFGAEKIDYASIIEKIRELVSE